MFTFYVVIFNKYSLCAMIMNLAHFFLWLKIWS